MNKEKKKENPKERESRGRAQRDRRMPRGDSEVCAGLSQASSPADCGSPSPHFSTHGGTYMVPVILCLPVVISLRYREQKSLVCGSQSVVPRLIAPATPGDLLDKYILRSHPRPSDSEILDLAPRDPM